MIIRPLDAADRAVWERLFSAYAAFYKTQIPDGAFDRVWGWIFDPDNEFWCDLALDEEGRAIGFVQYQLMHRSLAGAMVCYLSDLFVDPDVRGQGAGRALIDHVFGFARERGIGNVRWLTAETNYRARGLYDSYGGRSEFLLYSFGV